MGWLRQYRTIVNISVSNISFPSFLINFQFSFMIWTLCWLLRAVWFLFPYRVALIWSIFGVIPCLFSPAKQEQKLWNITDTDRWTPPDSFSECIVISMRASFHWTSTICKALLVVCFMYSLPQIPQRSVRSMSISQGCNREIERRKRWT